MQDAPAETVGQQVDRLRTRFGISMQDFAASVEIPFDLLWQLEQHPTHVPTRETLVRIAARFRELGASDADLALVRADIEKFDRAEREAQASEWIRKPGMKLMVMGLALTLGAPLVTTIATWNMASGSLRGFQRELVEDVGLPILRLAFFLGPVFVGIGAVSWAIARVWPKRG
jgi:transcriptional regulator with XRE-family HTH domain